MDSTKQTVCYILPLKNIRLKKKKNQTDIPTNGFNNENAPSKHIEPLTVKSYGTLYWRFQTVCSAYLQILNERLMGGKHGILLTIRIWFKL